MSREEFGRRLRELQADTMLLGGAVSAAVGQAVASLLHQDLALADAVIAGDAAINHARFLIEEKGTALMALQAPVATDLRLVVAIYNVIVDLERMGDHATGIARITHMVGVTPDVPPPAQLGEMAELARGMLDEAMDALINLDAAAAQSIAARDAALDALDQRILRDQVLRMLVSPRAIRHATFFTWASHNLERIADRVTNICERIIFVRTGVMAELGHSALVPVPLDGPAGV